MKELLIENYQPLLSLAQTQQAIGYVKDFFEKHLAASLGLVRVTAPLFLLPSTGLNDELTGKEKRVCFSLDKVAEEVEIVQSLAKWTFFIRRTSISGTGKRSLPKNNDRWII